MPNFFTNVGRANVWPTIQSGLQTMDTLKTNKQTREFNEEDQERKRINQLRADEQYQYYLDVTRPFQERVNRANVLSSEEAYASGQLTGYGRAGAITGGSALPGGLGDGRGGAAAIIAPSRGASPSRTARPAIPVPGVTSGPMKYGMATSPEAIQQAQEEAKIDEELNKPWLPATDPVIKQFGGLETQDALLKLMRDSGLINEKNEGKVVNRNQFLFRYYADKAFGDTVDKLYVDGARAEAGARANDAVMARTKHLKAMTDESYAAVRQAEDVSAKAQEKYSDAVGATNESTLLRSTISDLKEYADANGTTVDELAKKYPDVWAAAKSGKAELLVKAIGGMMKQEELEKREIEEKASFDQWWGRLQTSTDDISVKARRYMDIYPDVRTALTSGTYRDRNAAAGKLMDMVRAELKNEADQKRADSNNAAAMSRLQAKIDADKAKAAIKTMSDTTVREAKNITEGLKNLKTIDDTIIKIQNQLAQGIDPEGVNTYALATWKSSRANLIKMYPKMDMIVETEKLPMTEALKQNMAQEFAKNYQLWKNSPKDSPEEEHYANELRRLFGAKMKDRTIPESMSWEAWWEDMKLKNTQAPAEVGGAGYL